MIRAALAACVVALAACNPESETAETQLPSAPQAALTGACATSAASTWSGLALAAESGGADCATAAVRITIRDGADTLYTQNYAADQVMTLAGAESVEDLQRRLGEWITPAGAAMDSAGDLPAWAEGEDQPMSGEFPFYLEEGVDRAAYEAVRRRDAPLFCYVQGMESLACLVFESGALTKVGAQSFPG